MPIDLTVLGRRVSPRNSILLLGAGVSIPSGGPTSAQLSRLVAEQFEIETANDLALDEVATIVESQNQQMRRRLVEFIGSKLRNLQPTRGLLTLPDFDWAAIYTTNFDRLVEKAYERRGRKLNVVASNFDYSSNTDMFDSQLYKLHGTIENDISLGHQSRMVLTIADYDQASEYREQLFAKFAEQLMSHDALIVGNSLRDPDLKKLIDDALVAKKRKGAGGSISILVFEKDEHLGTL